MIQKELKIQKLCAWHVQKFDLATNREHQIWAKEKEVWWCAMGENIGVEINGKSSRFSRPAIIVRKLSQYNYIVVPLTSQKKSGSWYVAFVFRGKMAYAALSQIRMIDKRRLYERVGTLSDNDFALIKDGLQELLF